MKFALESYSQALIEEMLPLWRDHHAEIANEFYGPLDPDVSSYERVAKAGFLRIFTVREANALHGYQVFFVQRHPHSKNEIQATQDIIFLCKVARKGLNGYNFIKWCGEQLRAEGVHMVYQHISAHHDFGTILKRMGYVHLDQTYGRRLCLQQSQ